jgi:hypothetical protein
MKDNKRSDKLVLIASIITFVTSIIELIKMLLK